MEMDAFLIGGTTTTGAVKKAGGRSKKATTPAATAKAKAPSKPRKDASKASVSVAPSATATATATATAAPAAEPVSASTSTATSTTTSNTTRTAAPAKRVRIPPLEYWNTDKQQITVPSAADEPPQKKTKKSDVAIADDSSAESGKKKRKESLADKREHVPVKYSDNESTPTTSSKPRAKKTSPRVTEQPLPPGWTMTSKQRATGHLDCTWVAPNGLKFRSYKSVQDYCDKNGIQLSSSNIINNHEVHHDPEIQAVLEESIASSHAVTVSAASNHEDDEEDEEVPLTKPVKQKLSQRSAQMMVEIIVKEPTASSETATSKQSVSALDKTTKKQSNAKQQKKSLALELSDDNDETKSSYDSSIPSITSAKVSSAPSATTVTGEKKQIVIPPPVQVNIPTIEPYIPTHQPSTLQELLDRDKPSDPKNLQSVVDNLNRRLEEMRTLRYTAPESLHAQYKVAAEARYASYEEKLKELKAELDETRCAHQNALDTVVKMRGALEESNSVVAGLRAQVSVKEGKEGKETVQLRKEVETLRMEVEKVTKERDILRKESEAQMWEVEHLEEVCDELEAEKDGVLEEVEKLSKMDEESEREKKALREQVNTLSAKLESLEKLSLEASERPAQPDRYAQRLERMVRMYEELSQFKILSVEEARAEIDSDDDEDEEDEETEEEVVSQDEIDRARRRSVRRQSGVGKGLTKVRMPRLEDVLEHRCEMKGTRGEIQFTLTMPKVQTETSSPNILYTLHVAKDDEGRVMEEDDEELPEYLSGEMTFPRERLIDFFRKTVGWLFSA